MRNVSLRGNFGRMVFYNSNWDNWRARRSVIFVPASNRRALVKVRELECDGVIFDLEDSVAVDEQEKARENLLELVCGQDFGGQETIIRVSDAGSAEYSGDISTAIQCAPDAVLVPKVDSPGVLQDLEAMLDYSGAGEISIWAMIETAKSLVNLREIASCGGRLTCLVVGPNDLAKDTGAAMARGRQAMVPWLMDVVAHGRANGLGVLDGVLNNFKDEDWLAEECAQGAAMGFDGKTLIHPTQIATANSAFSPSDGEIKRARAVVEEFSKPVNQNKNAIQLDGEMIETLHLDAARNLLALMDRLNS